MQVLQQSAAVPVCAPWPTGAEYFGGDGFSRPARMALASFGSPLQALGSRQRVFRLLLVNPQRPIPARCALTSVTAGDCSLSLDGYALRLWVAAFVRTFPSSVPAAT